MKRLGLGLGLPELAQPCQRHPRRHARESLADQQRVDELAMQGHRFRNFLEREGCWYWEIFRFLKGQSRVIALADYSVEKTFVLTVPHQFLIGQPEHIAMQSAPNTPKSGVQKRRSRDCPF